MAEVRYLVMEILDLDEPIIRLTERYPDMVLDELLWRTQDERGDVYFGTILGRGLHGRAMEELLDAMRRASGEVTTHRRDDEGGTWLGTMVVPMDRVHDARSAVIHEYLGRHGLEARWSRIQGGAMYVRCELPRAVDGPELAARMRGFMEAKEVDVDIDIESASPGADGPWADLIEQLIDEPGFRLPFGFGF